MKLPTNLPGGRQKELDEKLKDMVRNLNREGYNNPDLVYIFRRTKGRISQIINNKSN